MARWPVQSYEFEDFDFLPPPLRPAYVSSLRNETLLAFFSKYSPLSNHYPVGFHLDGLAYVSMEQYLARSRAMMIKNLRLAARVMRLNDPADHKRILYKLKEDGKDDLWHAQIDTCLIPGLQAKFTQNTHARDFLLNTGDRRLGEATFDMFWGLVLT